MSRCEIGNDGQSVRFVPRGAGLRDLDGLAPVDHRRVPSATPVHARRLQHRAVEARGAAGVGERATARRPGKRADRPERPDRRESGSQGQGDRAVRGDANGAAGQTEATKYADRYQQSSVRRGGLREVVPVAAAHPDGQQEESTGGDRHVPEYTETAAARDSGYQCQLQEAECRVHRTRAAVSEGEARDAEHDEGLAIAHPVHQYGAGCVRRKFDGQSDRHVHDVGGDRGRVAKHQSRTEDAGATLAGQRNGQNVDGEHAEQAARSDLVHGGVHAEVRDGEKRDRRPVTENAV